MTSLPSRDTVTLRVRYPEVDRMKVAHHSHYLVWFEMGRTEFMRDRGVPYNQLEEEGVFFPVIGASLTFRRPAVYDQVLRVETQLERMTGATVTFRYSLIADGEAEPIATGETRHACTNEENRPRRLPEAIRARLAVE